MPEQLFQNLSRPELGIPSRHNNSQHSNSQNRNDENLVSNIKFIPSSKRILFRQMQLLHDDEVELLRAIIEDESDSSNNWKALSEIPIIRQIVVLDTLLAYHQYLMLSQNNEADSYTSKLKKRILLARLRLPAQQITKPENSYIESPEKGNREAVLHASLYSNENHEEGLTLGIAA